MLPEDVEEITSSSEGQRKRRRVEFGESDGESDSESDLDESDYEEEEEQGEELQESARTKQKSRACSRKQQSTKKGTCMCTVLLEREDAICNGMKVC